MSLNAVIVWFFKCSICGQVVSVEGDKIKNQYGYSCPQTSVPKGWAGRENEYKCNICYSLTKV